MSAGQEGEGGRVQFFSQVGVQGIPTAFGGCIYWWAIAALYQYFKANMTQKTEYTTSSRPNSCEANFPIEHARFLFPLLVRRITLSRKLNPIPFPNLTHNQVTHHKQDPFIHSLPQSLIRPTPIPSIPCHTMHASPSSPPTIR